VSTPIVPVARELASRGVRYVLIGVSGANFWAPDGQGRFVTSDFDFFLPLDAANLVNAWAACEAAGLSLWLGDEPLDQPRDQWLAGRMIERRALTRVTGPNELLLDLTLVMKGFEFEPVWNQRRDFMIEGVPVPTARLIDIIESKQAAGREKDQLFLATHLDALLQLLKKPDLE
jgi:hypothetical protein